MAVPAFCAAPFTSNTPLGVLVYLRACVCVSAGKGVVLDIGFYGIVGNFEYGGSGVGYPHPAALRPLVDAGCGAGDLRCVAADFAAVHGEGAAGAYGHAPAPGMANVGS